MTNRNLRWINITALALGIAGLPPLWAVVSPFWGVSTGAVALICAGLYVANGNKRRDAVKITIGFLLGDFWAVTALRMMSILEINPHLELYLTLFILGGLAVILGELFSRFIYLPSWLCGWAIGLTIMGPLSLEELGSLPLQIGASMIVGVVYVGIGVDLFQKALVSLIVKKRANRW